MEVECVIKNAAKTVGEGPHWDDVTNNLLYVDAKENTIHRYQPGTEIDESFQAGNFQTSLQAKWEFHNWQEKYKDMVNFKKQGS